MSGTGLSPTRIVSVGVSLAPNAVALANFGIMLILGPSAVIDVVQREREYSTITQVSADFGTNTPEYYAADAFFEQSPTPSTLKIGRWAKTATSGLLHGGLFSTTAQTSLLSSITAISAGSVEFTIDGTLRVLSALNFSAATTLSGIAAVINTALGSYASCVWNASLSCFDVTSSSSGASSSLSYGSPTGSGTDISSILQLTAGTGAQAPIAGIVAESPVACLGIHAAMFNDWYAVSFADTSITATQHSANASFIEASVPYRIYGVSTGDPNCLLANSTTDVAYVLSAAKYSRTFTQYSSQSSYAVCSFFGRSATVNYNANNTTLTMKFKTEPGIAPEYLTTTQANALEAKNCNVFVQYASPTSGFAIIEQGVMANGDFFDERVGLDWYQNYCQTAVLNVMLGATTKIPQTDPGIHLLVAAAESAGVQAVNNGLVAPGVWTSSLTFGTLQTGQVLSKGYYTYVAPIAQQNISNRDARQAPPIQQALTLAGAVHSASVIATFTR